MKKSLWKRILRIVLITFGIGVAAFALVITIKVISLDAWHEFDPDIILNADQTLIMYDSEGNEYVRLHSSEDRLWIPISDIPQSVIEAFISAEDARYYEHKGIDIVRVFGAAWQDLKAGGYVQGASTITQQLVKLSHLTSEKTISRKLDEMVLAYLMEKQFSKDEILEMYLNYVYFGRGYYGIEAAAEGYFGVRADGLSLAEAATLAGILKSPSNYAPHIEPEASLSRRNHILDLMEDYGYISADECDKAQSVPLQIMTKTEWERNYYIDAALEEACAALGIEYDELLTGGYRIYSYVDNELQKQCEALFDDGSLFPTEDCEGALAVVRSADGSVAATVGGRGEEYTAFAFNRSIDIARQPGSVIKPILVYAPALEHLHYTAATMLLDEQTDFNGYVPSNSDGKYRGWVTMRKAVTSSLNIPAVKVFETLGVKTGMEFASSLGIDFTEGDASLALALGGFTYGVSPLEIASAYAAFASGGVFTPYAFVKRIENSKGETVFERSDESERVMSEDNASILTDMLQSVIKTGTGRRLGETGIPLAGKTGTVNGNAGNRDAWMAAYNVEYSACCWMGYDSSEDGELPSGSTGGKYPALMLSALFTGIYSDTEPPEFELADGVNEVSLDLYSLEHYHEAVLANSYTPKSYVFNELFAEGTEPLETTEFWSLPSAVRYFTVVLSTGNKPLISFESADRRAVYRLYRSSNGGRFILVEQWNGSGSITEFEDTEAPYGTCRYYVTPYHIELEANGMDARGPDTATLSVFVRPEITMTPEETDDGDTGSENTGDSGQIEVEISDSEFPEDEEEAEED